MNSSLYAKLEAVRAFLAQAFPDCRQQFTYDAGLGGAYCVLLLGADDRPQHCVVVSTEFLSAHAVSTIPNRLRDLDVAGKAAQAGPGRRIRVTKNEAVVEG